MCSRLPEGGGVIPIRLLGRLPLVGVGVVVVAILLVVEVDDNASVDSNTCITSVSKVINSSHSTSENAVDNSGGGGGVIATDNVDDVRFLLHLEQCLRIR